MVCKAICCIAPHIAERMPCKYLWKYDSNVKELREKRDKLNSIIDGVKSLISAEMEIPKGVDDWLRKSIKLRDEVSVLISEDTVDEQETESGCCSLEKCMGCCKSCTCSKFTEWKNRRNIVAVKLKAVSGLLDLAESSRTSWEYATDVEKLKNELEKLRDKSASVDQRMEVGKKPLTEVVSWKERVEKTIKEVSGFISELTLVQQNNIRVAQMLKAVTKLLQEEPRGEVSYQTVPEQTFLSSGTQQEAFEPRQQLLDEILAELSKADVNMVGIHGPGGVGKSTLAKKVGVQAKEKNLDKIVLVEFSKPPIIKDMQEIIADRIGLQFTHESESGRAAKLNDVLKEEMKQGERILIILDNLWEEVIWEKVGIPFGDAAKKLKLLLTATFTDILINKMKSSNNFPVEPLSDPDSWILFQNIAPICVKLSSLTTIAQEVAKKYGGMPVAINAVAQVLKNKESINDWENVLGRLNDPSSKSIKGIMKKVYDCILVSYDYLSEDLQNIFLLCSRMAHTYNCAIQDLFMYGLGLGYFDDFRTLDEAFSYVYSSVQELKASSLLLDAHYDSTPSERFRIHDVICSAARSIASEDLLVTPALDDKIPWFLTIKEERLKKCTSITLYNVDPLPDGLKLKCPKIEFLCIQSDSYNYKIPDELFEGMPSLRVLHLIGIDLRSVPTSLSNLEKLQVLCLHHCKLGDVSVIGLMQELQILSFSHSHIEKLPEAMQQLTKLRLLDLTFCQET